jgi:TrmH family RNA methyltransferase
MTRRLSITSTSNDRLKAVRRLRRRGDRGVFLVEGHRQVREALAAGARVHEVYAAPELFLGQSDTALLALAERRGAHVVELGTNAFRSISGHVRADGLAAVVERWPTRLGGLRLPTAPLLAVAHGIERPGNLGTIARTAAAAGADALVVCDSPTDVFHPDAVRGSVGTLFHLRVAQAGTDRVLPWLAEHSIRLVVTSPDGARTHWAADYHGATAIVFGSERHGVTDPWLAAADEIVAIPMAGTTDSVNVAVAAGVVLFEAARRRNRDALTVAR